MNTLTCFLDHTSHCSERHSQIGIVRCFTVLTMFLYFILIIFLPWVILLWLHTDINGILDSLSPLENIAALSGIRDSHYTVGSTVVTTEYLSFVWY